MYQVANPMKLLLYQQEGNRSLHKVRNEANGFHGHNTELVGKLPLLLGSAAWIKQRHLHHITNVSYEML